MPVYCYSIASSRHPINRCALFFSFVSSSSFLHYFSRTLLSPPHCRAVAASAVSQFPCRKVLAFCPILYSIVLVSPVRLGLNKIDTEGIGHNEALERVKMAVAVAMVGHLLCFLFNAMSLSFSQQKRERRFSSAFVHSAATAVPLLVFCRRIFSRPSSFRFYLISFYLVLWVDGEKVGRRCSLCACGAICVCVCVYV